MKTMINYALAVFPCLLILSCSSKETKYVEIKEPENTKKIIETRYYETAGEIDGDYIPGEELRGLFLTPTKNFYGADDKILLSIEDYGYSDYEQKYSMTFTNYNYDSNHQLDNITEVHVQRSDVGWTGIVELIDTTANLTFKRNELGLVTEIEGFGTVITPDDKVYEVTKFIYNKDGKIVKEIHDSHDYKTYQYFSLRNGHTAVKCDVYGEQRTLNFPAYQGKTWSLTKIYDNGQKVKSLEQTYSYGKLYLDKETTFVYDDKNRMIQIIKKRAEAEGMFVLYQDETYEDYMNKSFEMLAGNNEITEYKYDKKGNLIYVKTGYRKPELHGNTIRIGNKNYFYEESSVLGSDQYKYYFNEHGDWYKYDLIRDGVAGSVFGNEIAIRNIEYRR